MATVKNLSVLETASGEQAPTLPKHFVRKFELDAAISGLGGGHAPVTVQDTSTLALRLVSNTQLLYGFVRRKVTSLGLSEGLLGEDPNGLFVVLGLSANQAAKGTDMAAAQIAITGKAPLSHSHAISDVTNLQTTLDGKAATNHSHAISDVTGLQTALDGKAASSHSHSDATISAAGFMSAADKTKLDGISVSGTGRYAGTVGDGSATQINVTHGRATEDVIVQVRKANDPKENIDCTVKVVDVNTVQLIFAAPPALNSLRVVVI